MKKKKQGVKIIWYKDGSMSILPSSQEAMEKYTKQISDLAFKLLDEFMKDMTKKGKRLEKIKNKREVEHKVGKTILKVVDVDGSSVSLSNKYVDLQAPRRSQLMSGINPVEGDFYEVNLMEVNPVPRKKKPVIKKRNPTKKAIKKKSKSPKKKRR